MTDAVSDLKAADDSLVAAVQANNALVNQLFQLAQANGSVTAAIEAEVARVNSMTQSLQAADAAATPQAPAPTPAPSGS